MDCVADLILAAALADSAGAAAAAHFRLRHR
jgi:hypothetical protein